MKEFNFKDTENYISRFDRLLRTHSEESALEDLKLFHYSKINEIGYKEKRQMNWILGGYAVAALGALAIVVWPDWGWTVAFYSALYMNMAAYNYGKYKFFASAEESAFATFERYHKKREDKPD